MDKRYEPYCLNDPLFYDSPVRPCGREPGFEDADSEAPPGWERSEMGDWIVYRPRGGRLPAQGWKVHASACLDNARTILEAVRAYCIPRSIAFKFVRSKRLLLLHNSKSAHRFSSGKFITIYPSDDAQLERLLDELGALVKGQKGPTILSDLRCGPGPLHVRYGGYVKRTCTAANGEQVPALEGPGGTLVPDQRGSFAVPPWLDLPDFLRPHLQARSSSDVADLPYEVRKALHFSNGGGVYQGFDRRNGDPVVIKEARPHAGLSADGTDALARLEHERNVLERLSGLAAVPAVKGQFTAGGHHFLVLEKIEGDTLDSLFAARYPLIAHDCSPDALADHADWAVALCHSVEAAAETVHARGLAIQDLHPSNIMVEPGGRIVFVDWEIASAAHERRAATLGDASFAAPRGTTGIDVDRYALACLRLWLFLPLTALIRLDPGKAPQLGAEICDLFPVPRGFIAQAVEVIDGIAAARPGNDGPGPRQPAAFDPAPPSWPDLRASFTRAILASATPERDDRLFPGDIAQFAPGGGTSLAHGAAGVLYALQATGSSCHADHVEWLTSQARRAGPDVPPGFFDGLHGIAHVLDKLEHRGDALALLDMSIDRFHRDGDQQAAGLFSGLAGIGLNLAHFADRTGEAALRDLASNCAQRIADRLGDPDRTAGEDHHAGLFHGWAGPALLFVRLYEAGRDPAFLDLAKAALDRDLAHCQRRDDGSIQVDQGWRAMPYLADGSAGILMVLNLFLAHRPDERLSEAAAAMRKAAEVQFYIQPGLSRGLAGMILCLCHTSPAGEGWKDLIVAAQLRRLARYLVPYQGGLAGPGEQLLRLSMDLTTGSAGLSLALGAALHECPVYLPFLGPPLDRD